MKIASRIVFAALALLTVMAAGGKFAWATVTCPPLCLLPPDPAPPMPPINFPDPPFRPLAVSNPNGGSNGTGQVGSACQIQNFTGKVTLVNGQYDCDVTPVVGSSCPAYPNSTDNTGTVTVVGGKYACVYTPPAAGSACQYQNSTGTVTVIGGARYCNIGTSGATSTTGGTDTIVQRIAEPKVTSTTGASSTTGGTDTIVQRIDEPKVTSTTGASSAKGVSSTTETNSAPAAAEDNGSSSTTQKKPK